MKPIHLLIYIIISLLVTITACKSRQQKCLDCLKKAQEYGCLNLDSSVKYTIKTRTGDSLNIKDSLVISHHIIDSLRYVTKDTCYTEKRAKTLLKYASIKPLDTTTKLGNHIRVWTQNGIHMIQVEEKTIHDTTKIVVNSPTVHTCNEFNWWKVAFWISLGGSFILLFLALKNRKKK